LWNTLSTIAEINDKSEDSEEDSKSCEED